MEIVERLRDALEGTEGIKETKMFGGICFMLNGNMCVGVWHDWMIARVGVVRLRTNLGTVSHRCGADVLVCTCKAWAKPLNCQPPLRTTNCSS